MNQPTQAKVRHHLIRWNGTRVFLSFYFCVYVYVVAQGLFPLPDQPPRIDFFGVLCVTGGLAIAIQCLFTDQRRFRYWVLAFIPVAAWQLVQKIKFLEMMLEPHLVENMTRYSLGVVFLVFLTPQVGRLFSKTGADRGTVKPLFFDKGVPF